MAAGTGKGRGEVAAGPRLAFLLVVATSLIFTGASANKSQKYKNNKKSTTTTNNKKNNSFLSASSQPIRRALFHSSAQ